jgi:hypothetical protein
MALVQDGVLMELGTWSDPTSYAREHPLDPLGYTSSEREVSCW